VKIYIALQQKRPLLRGRRVKEEEGVTHHENDSLKILRAN